MKLSRTYQKWQTKTTQYDLNQTLTLFRQFYSVAYSFSSFPQYYSNQSYFYLDDLLYSRSYLVQPAICSYFNCFSLPYFSRIPASYDSFPICIFYTPNSSPTTHHDDSLPATTHHHYAPGIVMRANHAIFGAYFPLLSVVSAVFGHLSSKVQTSPVSGGVLPTFEQHSSLAHFACTVLGDFRQYYQVVSLNCYSLQFQGVLLNRNCPNLVMCSTELPPHPLMHFYRASEGIMGIGVPFLENPLVPPSASQGSNFHHLLSIGLKPSRQGFSSCALHSSS
ncbi:hypothetical protein SS50377_25225 [Spironucleus salmonicida]|uniref:Uncharacterized protein n=1 Tax=Spironucleus salmonicida TaxID=348837 RepID=V6LWR8_9EUKA|nr:hypothetical protein SS50377_25225 [Spironucleus salmonicida]|eukprot:EST49092.1 Hypothetical protein SS50377_10644 [Spironucleus salmonicida]